MYKVKSHLIIIELCIFGFIGLLYSFIFLSFFYESVSDIYQFLISFFICVLWGLFIFILIKYKNKNRVYYVLITENSFIAQYKTKRNELFYDDIEGYEVLKSSIIIKSNNKAKESIVLNTELENHNEFVNFLARNYNSLDSVNEAKIKEEFYSNEFHGKTIEERELKKVSQINKLNILQILLVLVFALGIFFDTVLIISPLLVFIAYYYFKYISECIDIFESFWFSVGIYCMLNLILIAIKDSSYEVIERFSNLIYHFIFYLILISIILIYLKIKKGVFFEYQLIAYLIVHLWLSIYLINLNGGENIEKYIKMKINNKYKEKKKNGYSYCVDLEFVEDKNKNVTLYSNIDKFDSINLGDTISLPMCTGRLNAPYVLENF